MNFLNSFPDFGAYIESGRITTQGIYVFQNIVRTYYVQCGRDFAWRQTQNPYHILVSEIMLQQTQIDRVISKYQDFIQRFGTIEDLARAPFAEVLVHWQGLGYNRRALGLHKTAQTIARDYAGIIPPDPIVLQTFDGIGPYTAASVCAFAFDMPTVFIETNIRSVYLHTFFRDQKNITDKQLLPLVQATLDMNNPRTWYYGLMDYGVALKKMFKNPSRKSAHHTQQSRFEGSERQIRGMILRSLTTHGSLTLEELAALIPRQLSRIRKNAESLIEDGLIVEHKGCYRISN